MPEPESLDISTNHSIEESHCSPGELWIKSDGTCIVLNPASDENSQQKSIILEFFEKYFSHMILPFDN